MESREKAKMKVALNRSRIPTFLFVVLVIMVCVLTYNYWTTSSSNEQLLLKLRLAQGERIITDRKRYALEDKIANMESENRLLEDDLVNNRAIKERALTLTSDLKVELQTVREKLNIAVENEKSNQEELEKLRKGVDRSSSEFKALTTKADKVLKKFNDVKANQSALLEELSKLKAERDRYQKDLLKVKVELDEAKKAKASPVDKKASSTSKVSDEGESVVKADEKGSSKLKRDEKEEPDKNQSKSRVVDEEKEDNEENEGEGEKVTKELVEKKSKPSIVKAVQEGSDLSKDKKIPSPTVNVSTTAVPGVNKSGENKSQSEGGSEVKPTDQRTTVKSKENDKQESRKAGEEEEEGEEEENEEQRTTGDEEENAEEEEDGEKTPKKEAASDKEKDGVNDEEDEALDDKEKVQQSMDSPLGDRVLMRPHPRDSSQEGPKGPKSAGQDRFHVGDEINKFGKDMMSRGQDPRGMARNIPDSREESRRSPEQWDEEDDQN